MADEDQAQREPTPEEIAEKDRADREHARQLREQERRAKLGAHPHTRLHGILSDMAKPAANQADIHTRVAYLHSAVRQLVQLVLEHTPPPDEALTRPESDDGEEQRERQSVEGTDKQVAVGS